MSAILSVRGLEKTFGSVIAARDISLDVPCQQSVGIIGANGAGKTTFVNMITGYLRPSKGSIRFEDRDITGLPSRAITRLGIARSFQVAQVFPSLTVHENVGAAVAVARTRPSLLKCALTPLTSAPALAEAEELVTLFQLGDYREARAATLPQGVRKLLDIAMALVGAPRVLLLDEPTSGISIEEKFAVMDVIMTALASRRTTVLFVEHDMEIVARFRQRRALELSGGQQKMVALARALMAGTRILLLDEPFEGVAPALARRLGEVLASLKSERVSVLIAESNESHVADLLARAFRIERGSVTAV
jgi:branched-chain amino acid transport system ATP-binding protein